MKKEINGHYFTVLKSDGQKANTLKRNFYYAHNKEHYTLWSVYGKPSDIKERIFWYWRDFCQQIDGKGFCIPSYNSQVFSVAFTRYNYETEKYEMFYITKGYNYMFEM